MSLPAKKLRVLNLEDDPNDGELVLAELQSEWAGLDFLRVATRDAFIRALDEFSPDIVLSDFKLPDIGGREALLIVKQTHPDIPVVMVTGALGDVEAVELIKLGAKDYVMKDHLQRLVPAVQGAISHEMGIRARKEAEFALRQSEAEVRALVERSPVAMLVDESDGPAGRVVMMNRRFTALFGYTLEEVPDLQRWWELAHPDERYRLQLQSEWKALVERADDGVVEPIEVSITCKDGSIRYVRVTSVATGNRNIVTFEDLTRYKQAEGRIRRLNQLYAALSQCNEHIMRSDTQEALFTLVCRDAVQIGGMRMAWVGMVDEASSMLKPIAQFGDGTGYLQDIRISVDETSPYGRGPTGTAVREKRPYWCQDFQHDPATEPWHERGERFGWHASASLPLAYDGRAVGALTLYAGEIDAFDEATRNLVQEMVANISFALGKFASEKVRKTQQDELLAAKNSLQATLDAIPDLMFEVDLQGTYFNAHAPHNSLLPVPVEQIIGRNVADFLPPDAVAVCLEALREANERGWSVGRQYRLPGHDGELWYELSISRLPGASGQDHRFIALARNITERKQKDAQMLKLLQAVEQSPNTIVITDLDANIEYANPAFSRATGYELEEAIGKNPRILQSGKTRRESYDEMWASLTQGNVWRGEFVNRRKDGTEYIEAVQISPVRQPDGRITNYLAIKEDITASKQMQESILHNARRMEAMLKLNAMGVGGTLSEKELLQAAVEYAEDLTSSRISFIHIVNDGGKSIELVAWSAATSAHYCNAAYDTHYPVDQAGIWADSLRTKEAVIFNDYAGYPHKRGLPEGHAELRRLISVPVVEEGTVRLILGVGNKETDYTSVDTETVQLIGIDVWRVIRRMRAETDLKHALAEQRELNARLEQARSQLLQSEKMAAIGLLAAGVAHEINNPVGYVNSNLGTLEKYLADIFAALDAYESMETELDSDSPLLEELRQLRTRIDLGYLRTDIKALLAESHQGLERIKKIILDLKDFSRSEVDEQWAWADLHHGLDSTLNVVWNELKYKCEVVKEYGELPEVWCLPSQLNQVFMNLLVNAAQAIEVRGRITIRTGVEGDRVWVEVSDTGKGIPPEIMPRLFDPFFTTKPPGKGTGLGLSVSYNIVEKHRGKFEVHSEPGRGATFRVWLPIQSQEKKERNA